MTLAAEALPLADLGGSALAAAYAAGRPEATAFYRHAPHDPDARAEAAQAAAEAATARGTRDAVADVLAEQNRAWGASQAVLDAVDALRESESVAVVTGQQLGLFGGPLYTVWKAVSAVRLAGRLAEETGRAVVPVFWLADEDHDFAEIQTAAFARGEEVHTATYRDGPDPTDDRGPVGRIVLSEQATQAALVELEAALPDGPYRADALEMARAAYQPGRTMRDAFALLTRALVPDVVLMSADDSRLKALGANLFRREANDWQGMFETLGRRSQSLIEAGYHAQVAPSPVNLFWMENGARTPLDPEGDRFRLRGTERALSTVELVAEIDDRPETLSPNVVLRPLLQDTLLPTAAYVAGPGEASYFAQLTPVYARLGVPMPVVEPRLSLTVVEPGVAKIMDRYGLSVPESGEDRDALWRRFALDASALDLEDAFAKARQSALAAVEALAPVVGRVDSGMGTAVGAARRKVEKALEVLETKTVRREKRNHEVVRERIERLQAALWPDGRLQERALGPLGLVARYGVGGMREIAQAVPLDGSVHHAIRT